MKTIDKYLQAVKLLHEVNNETDKELDSTINLAISTLNTIGTFILTNKTK
jgi:hypothetical protein